MLNAVLNLPGCHDTVCKLLPGKIVKITNKHRSIAKYPVNNTPHYWYQNFRKNSQFNLQKVFKQDIIYISGNPRLNEMSSTKSMCLQFDVGDRLFGFFLPTNHARAGNTRDLRGPMARGRFEFLLRLCELPRSFVFRCVRS